MNRNHVNSTQQLDELYFKNQAIYILILLLTTSTDTQNWWCENHINKKFVGDKLAESTYHNITHIEVDKLWYLIVTSKHYTLSEHNI